MKHSLARRAFKDHLGQANHFLITILVSLDCLNNNPQFESPGLHAAWSPRDVSASVHRARMFSMHSFLGTAVDALDVYFSLLGRKPDFLQVDALRKNLQSCERSVYKKASVIAAHVPGTKVEAALVELLITWRNNVMHELADNVISEESKAALSDSASAICHDYRGLDVSQIVNKAEKGEDLTFKETASLINAAHAFVEKCDTYILNRLDLSRLYAETIKDFLTSRDVNHTFRTRLFDVEAPRWPSFISTWIGSHLRVPPLCEQDIVGIKDIVMRLRQQVG